LKPHLPILSLLLLVLVALVTVTPITKAHATNESSWHYGYMNGRPNLDPPLAQLKHQAHVAYNYERDAQAISLFKQILHITPKDPQTLTNLGNTENDLTNFTGGLYYFQKALKYDPRHIGSLLGIGDSLEGLSNHSAALVYYKEAASTPIPIKQQHTKLGFVEQIEKANALIDLSNYTQALSIDDAMLKQNATNMDALGSKGAVLTDRILRFLH
jgi:tetratricopeptide (TPR) repeat protein